MDNNNLVTLGGLSFVDDGIAALGLLLFKNKYSKFKNKIMKNYKLKNPNNVKATDYIKRGGTSFKLNNKTFTNNLTNRHDLAKGLNRLMYNNRKI